MFSKINVDKANSAESKKLHAELVSGIQQAIKEMDKLKPSQNGAATGDQWLKYREAIEVVTERGKCLQQFIDSHLES